MGEISLASLNLLHGWDFTGKPEFVTWVSFHWQASLCYIGELSLASLNLLHGRDFTGRPHFVTWVNCHWQASICYVDELSLASLSLLHGWVFTGMPQFVPCVRFHSKASICYMYEVSLSSLSLLSGWIFTGKPQFISSVGFLWQASNCLIFCLTADFYIEFTTSQSVLLCYLFIYLDFFIFFLYFATQILLHYLSCLWRFSLTNTTPGCCICLSSCWSMTRTLRRSYCTIPLKAGSPQSE